MVRVEVVMVETMVVAITVPLTGYLGWHGSMPLSCQSQMHKGLKGALQQRASKNSLVARPSNCSSMVHKGMHRRECMAPRHGHGKAHARVHVHMKGDAVQHGTQGCTPQGVHGTKTWLWLLAYVQGDTKWPGMHLGVGKLG